MKKTMAFFSCITCLFIAGTCLAATEAELAEESVQYAVSTRKEKPTPPSLVVEKVGKACMLLEREGVEAFPKFKGKGSEFIYEGTYIWIHDLTQATMLMHPIKYKMVGNRYIGLKDRKGKRFFTIMNSIVKERKSGWVDYMWPIPGKKGLVRKISFVRGCTMSDGTEVVIGSGLYNYDEADVKKLDIH